MFFKGWPRRTWKSSLDAWFNEYKDYNYWCNRRKKTSKPTAMIGHYTQMVWATTTHVGCGKAKCKNRGPFRRYGGRMEQRKSGVSDKNEGCCNHIIINQCFSPSIFPFSKVHISFWAAAPKGPMTYAFTHRGNFSFSSSFSVHPLRSSYPGLGAKIPV